MSNDEAKTKSSRGKTILIGAIALMFACGLCGIMTLIFSDGDTDADVAERSTAVAIAGDSQESEPAATPQPTDTHEPTATAEPTNTPQPTSTPRPTNTPRPTPSPTPPPEPIVLTGSGDAIVDLEKWPGPALVRISGNSGRRHFSVVNHDAAGTYLDLLVNTTEPYDGLRPLDFYDGVLTTRFEVTATGQWQIEVLPLLEHATRVDVPGTVAGSGDDVLLLVGEADTAAIRGNALGRHFAVHSYGLSADLLVNTTEPYDGTVLIPRGGRVLVVSADGEWEMDLTAR
jgi:hypothetical protein